MLSILFMTVSANTGNETTLKDRQDKSLGVFTVVKFPNDVCLSATSGRNGTCYTQSECNAKGGSSSGSCASGFGVCCVFEKSCGAGAIAENCTYFTSSERSTGAACSITICKSDSDVCQLRLDFETFVLSNPVTDVAAVIGFDNAGNTNQNRVGNCDTDFFSVTSPGSKAPPIICGVATGQHMYVPLSTDDCSILSANFGTASTATSSAFTIKVTQVECSSKRLAPTGCLQYLTSMDGTGTLNTFNYNAGAGTLLANQDYNICIRQERTYCAICYSAAAGGAPTFGMSYPGLDANAASGVDVGCGHVGAPGIDTITTVAVDSVTWEFGGAYDHIVIPNGQCDVTAVNIATAMMSPADRYCGTVLQCWGDANTGAAWTAITALIVAALNPTVCTMSKPFMVGVKSDGTEMVGANAANAETILLRNMGFQITYYQKTSCLTRPAA